MGHGERVCEHESKFYGHCSSEDRSILNCQSLQLKNRCPGWNDQNHSLNIPAISTRLPVANLTVEKASNAFHRIELKPWYPTCGIWNPNPTTSSPLPEQNERVRKRERENKRDGQLWMHRHGVTKTKRRDNQIKTTKIKTLKLKKKNPSLDLRANRGCR